MSGQEGGAAAARKEKQRSRIDTNEKNEHKCKFKGFTTGRTDSIRIFCQCGLCVRKQSKTENRLEEVC